MQVGLDVTNDIHVGTAYVLPLSGMTQNGAFSCLRVKGSYGVLAGMVGRFFQRPGALMAHKSLRW